MLWLGVHSAMPNRTLTADELALASALLADTRARLQALAADDAELLFALRRKVFEELSQVQP